MQSFDLLRKLAVFDRERIEQVLSSLLDCRAREDFVCAADLFAPHMTLEVIGDRRHFQHAGTYQGLQAAMEALNGMKVEVEFLDQETTEMLIDGDRAMLRRRILVRHRGTGVSLAHEIWDVLRFEDGLVVHWAKFIDTQAYQKLQGLLR